MGALDRAGVTAAMATALDLGIPSSVGAIARLFVVALFLASVSPLDPWNLVGDSVRQESPSAMRAR